MAAGASAGLPTPPQAFSEFAAEHPDVVAAYELLTQRIRSAGPLSDREVALVKLAISIGARMEGAAHAHARKALSAGVEPESLEHVVLLACPTIGFPNMMAARGWLRDVLAER